MVSEVVEAQYTNLQCTYAGWIRKRDYTLMPYPTPDANRKKLL